MGRLVALDGLDLEVRDGEFFVLLGPSGAGKTTTLKCVAGLETPSAGRVFIGGRDVTEVEPNARRVAMAFENYALYPQETVYDNIVFPLRSRRYYVPPTGESPRGAGRPRLGSSTSWNGCRGALRRATAAGGAGARAGAPGRCPASGRAVVPPRRQIAGRHARRVEVAGRAAAHHQSLCHPRLPGGAGPGGPHRRPARGKLAQVGDREDLWHRPVDLFVAQAFGQPRINLLKGAISTRGWWPISRPRMGPPACQWAWGRWHAGRAWHSPARSRAGRAAGDDRHQGPGLRRRTAGPPARSDHPGRGAANCRRHAA